MRLAAAIQGDLARHMREEIASAERAVTAGMRETARELTAALRADVVGAGLGERLARAWRGKVYPEAGESIEAAAFVWSKAPKLIDAFNRGVTIRSRNGFWLAIPTPAAGARGIGAGGRRARITPGGWERRTGMRLRFVYRRRGPSLLVADNARLNARGLAMANRRKTGQATVVVFLLVPQVRLRKRLNVEAIARRQADRVPALIARNWMQS
jgi:hypothetical protein